MHRITGDGPPDLMIAMWSLNKWEVLNSIDAEFVRGSWQGKYANEEKQNEIRTCITVCSLASANGSKKAITL